MSSSEQTERLLVLVSRERGVLCQDLSLIVNLMVLKKLLLIKYNLFSCICGEYLLAHKLYQCFIIISSSGNINNCPLLPKEGLKL